jgi:hypothetical protein
MNVWDDLQQNFSKRSREWLSWAKQHAQEIGEAGVRHVERQDLLSERKQLVKRIGEEVTNRFLLKEMKTVRADSPEIKETILRIQTIDDRLAMLASIDRTEAETRAKTEKK